MVSLFGFGYKPPSAVDKPYFTEPSKGDLAKAKLARDAKDRPTGYGNLIGSGIISAVEGARKLTPRDILNAPYNAVTAGGSMLGGLASSVGKSLETMVKPSGALYKYPGMTGLSPVSPAQQKATTDTGLNLMGLSAVPGTAARIAGKEVARSDSTLGMFLGESAKTADKAALTKAKKMTKAGKSRDSILKQTGWFKDSADKRWKFEISDIDARLAAVPANVYRGDKMFGGDKFFDNRKNYLDQVLDHPELYEAYPFLRDIEFDLVKDLTKRGNGTMGTYSGGPFQGSSGRTASIQLDARLTQDGVARMLELERKLKKDTASYREQIEYGAFRDTYPDYLSLDEWVKRERKEKGDGFANAEQMAKAEKVGYDEYFGADYQRDLFDNFSPNIADNYAASRSVMLHEVQHAIQDAENFAMGGGTGSKRYVEKSTKKGMERKEALGTLANALKDEKGNVKPRYKASKETRILDEMVTDVAEELKSLGMYVNTGEGSTAIRNFRPRRSEMKDPTEETRGARKQEDTRIPLLDDKIWLQVQNGKVVKGDLPNVPIKDLHNQLMENGATLKQANRLMKDIKTVYGFQNDLPKYFDVTGQRHSLVKNEKGTYQASEKQIPTALASPLQGYRRIAGEAEARNVETRARLSPEELRTRAPWKTIDTDPDLLTAITRVPENNPYTRPTLMPPTETGNFRRFKGIR